MQKKLTSKFSIPAHIVEGITLDDLLEVSRLIAQNSEKVGEDRPGYDQTPLHEDVYRTLVASRIGAAKMALSIFSNEAEALEKVSRLTAESLITAAYYLGWLAATKQVAVTFVE